MDRCAVFVDAGYLLAAGGDLCCGTTDRSEVSCNYETLVDFLVRAVSDDARMPVLRVYWYDAAPNALPLTDHQEIAQLANVKLRLGRLTGGKQKGVDSLIIRDLMTLARERAIATAYLISGDEDIREGVVAAQDMGVRVVLLGIPPASQRFNQARTLTREADQHVVLEAEMWTRHFSRIEIPPGPDEPPEDLISVAESKGREFGGGWAANATNDELLELLGRAPVIPRELDVQLLRSARESLGATVNEDEPRHAVRRGFWTALEDARNARLTPGAPTGEES